jgi:hypothetical protein
MALCATLAVNSVVRVRRFTPDSMLYVDAARNVANGRGLASNVFGLNQPGASLDAALPVPFTTYAPLYPIVVALASRLGPEAAEAALLVAALGWLAVVLLGWALARRAWGGAAGRLAAALLVLSAPLHDSGTAAWSETLATALLLASFLALPAQASERVGGRGRLALSGLCAGLAFAARYALLPVVALGLFAVLVRGARSRSWLRALFDAVVWGVAALAPVAAVLAHNRLADGEWLPGAGPSHVSFAANLGAALRVLLGGEFTVHPSPAVAVVVAVTLALAAVLAWRRGTLHGLVRGRAGVLVAWTAFYFAVLVVTRTLRDFDPIDARLLLPCGVTAAIVASGLVTRAVTVPRGLASFALVVALLVAGEREARVLSARYPRTTASEIAASPRLAWLAAHTSPADLVFGDAASDVMFYDRRRVITFWPDPSATPPTLARVREYWSVHRGEYAQCWIVVSNRVMPGGPWEGQFGPWFDALAAGRDSVSAGLTRVAQLRDGRVYRYADSRDTQ